MKLSELIENFNKVKESNGDIEIIYENKYNYIESFDMYEYNKLFLVDGNKLLIDLTEEL